MNLQNFFKISVAMGVAVLVVGCNSDDQAAEAPPTVDAQVGAQNAQAGIESSPEMTAEQKQQALQYNQQGAAAAERQKALAGQAADGH